MSALPTLTLSPHGPALELLDLPGRADRPALVVLHEGLGSVGLWRSFPAELQRRTGRRVVAFSRAGHGGSEPPREPRTAAFFHHEALEVLPALLAEVGVQDPVLLGHSDGASIALIHAAQHRVSALVLIAPHVFVEAVTVAAIRETREAYLNGDLRERMARHHADPDAAFWGWCRVWLDPEFRRWSLEPEAARVTAPTLLIQGTEDPYGSVEQVDRIEARMRGAVQRLILAGGHSPHLDQGQATVGAIADFLAGPGAGTEPRRAD